MILHPNTTQYQAEELAKRLGLHLILDAATGNASLSKCVPKGAIKLRSTVRAKQKVRT